MKKQLLLSLLAMVFIGNSLSAQTTETFVVADNGNRVSSCVDSLIDLEDIYRIAGIRDLNDPNDNISNYRILRLEGSVITTDELTQFKISDYPSVFIDKKTVPLGNRTGIQVWVSIVTPPDSLFRTNFLDYTVDRGGKINISKDVFTNLNLWSNGLPEAPLQDRMIFTNSTTGNSSPISQLPNWGEVGKGSYKIKVSVAGCNQNSVSDSIFITVQETLCNSVVFKNLPPVCLNQLIDITPYIYVNGTVATSIELADMTFYDKSNSTNPTPPILNPTAVNISQMFNTTTLYPSVEIVYQPNVALGICPQYIYRFSTKVPTMFLSSGVVITNDNYGQTSLFELGGNFKSFNNVFHKNVLKKLYIDNYTGYSGSVLNFYSDNQFQNPVAGDNLAPGDYTGLITNPACNTDSTTFAVNISNTDFEITWQGATNLGKGYYIFNAPSTYPGATYEWFAWGGNIVAGSGTNQITVYYSEKASQSVTVSCQITLPVPPNTRAAAGGYLNGALYLTASNQTGALEEIKAKDEVVTGIEDTALTSIASAVYPNPSEGTFAISGAGEYELKAYDILGQLIHSNNAYTANAPVNITNKGVYFIHLTQNGNRQILKVILK